MYQFRILASALTLYKHSDLFLSPHRKAKSELTSIGKLEEMVTMSTMSLRFDEGGHAISYRAVTGNGTAIPEAHIFRAEQGMCSLSASLGGFPCSENISTRNQ